MERVVPAFFAAIQYLRRLLLPGVVLVGAGACATVDRPPVTVPVTKPVPPRPPPAPPAPPPARIEGRVHGADGMPVEGAGVDLLPVTPEGRSAAVAPLPLGLAAWPARERTRAEGRFGFDGLAAGEYRLCAFAAGFALGPGVYVTVAPGEVKAIEVSLSDEGVAVRGAVTDARGQPLAAPHLAVRPAAGGDGCADVAVDGAGAFEVLLSRGQYVFSASAVGFEPRSVEAAVERSRTVTLALDTPPVLSPAPAPVTGWLAQAALPLSTVEPGSNPEDLRPLAELISGVRLVGLGESTPGAHEFFRLKHRLLEYFATEQGFTVLGLETGFSESQAINDYVLTGKGEPSQVLAGLGQGVADTEEMWAVVQWMRAYNAQPRHKRKLQVYGFDMPQAAGATRAVLNYLARVDPNYLAQVEARLNPLLELDLRGAAPGEARERVEPLASEVTALATRLVIKREAYTRRLSAREWALAARSARGLGQFIAFHRSADTAERVAARAEAMAENVQWMLEQAGPDARMVLWANTGHLAGWGEGRLHPTLGKRLREAYGPAYHAFAFVSGEGTFQAASLSEGPGVSQNGRMPFPVQKIPEDTVEATLLATGVPLFAVDLRNAPREGAVGSFWQERRRMRATRAGETKGGELLSGLRVREDFDGLFFMAHTTASRPRPPE